jgi:hypothetical protein
MNPDPQHWFVTYLSSSEPLFSNFVGRVPLKNQDLHSDLHVNGPGPVTPQLIKDFSCEICLLEYGYHYFDHYFD